MAGEFDGGGQTLDTFTANDAPTAAPSAPDVRALIDQSRKMGATDDQIRSLMTSAPFLQDTWKQSEKAGISPDQVFAHFGIAPATDQPSSSPVVDDLGRDVSGLLPAQARQTPPSQDVQSSAPMPTLDEFGRDVSAPAAGQAGFNEVVNRVGKATKEGFDSGNILTPEGEAAVDRIPLVGSTVINPALKAAGAIGLGVPGAVIKGGLEGVAATGDVVGRATDMPGIGQFARGIAGMGESAMADMMGSRPMSPVIADAVRSVSRDAVQSSAERNAQAVAEIGKAPDIDTAIKAAADAVSRPADATITVRPDAPVKTITRSSLTDNALTGRPDGEISSSDAANAFHGQIANAVSQGDQVFHVARNGRETELTSRDGKTVQSADGAGVGWMGLLSDTGDRIEIRPSNDSTITTNRTARIQVERDRINAMRSNVSEAAPIELPQIDVVADAPREDLAPETQPVAETSNLDQPVAQADTPASIPKTVAEAKSIANAWYRRADELGGTLTPEFTNRLIDEAEKIAPQTAEGKAIAGDTTITGLVDRMQNLRDDPISLKGAQEIDEKLGDLIDKEYGMKGLSKEGRNIQELQTTFRNMILDAKPEDTTGGTDGFAALQQGRAAWSQAMKMNDVERILNRAEQTDNPVTSIRAGVRTLTSNPSRIRGWTEEEVTALQDAAKRGALGSVLHVFGSRLAPLAAGAAGMTGGPIGGLVSAGVAHVATSGMRNLATAIQTGRANDALAVLGKGVPAPPTARATVAAAATPEAVAPVQAAPAPTVPMTQADLVSALTKSSQNVRGSSEANISMANAVAKVDPRTAQILRSAFGDDFETAMPRAKLANLLATLAAKMEPSSQPLARASER